MQTMQQLDASATDETLGMDALIIATLLGTGVRAAELSGFEVGDVSVLNSTIGVSRTKTKVRAGEIRIAEPKSDNSTRVLPMGPDLATAMAAYLQRHPHRHDPTAPLFPARRANNQGFDWTRPVEPGTFRQRRLRPALVVAGLDPKLRLHDLRHTYGTTLIENGAPVEKVSLLMGHASIQITMDIYVHLNTAAHHDVVAVLPGLLRTSPIQSTPNPPAKQVDSSRLRA